MLIFGLFFVRGENINAFGKNVADAQEIRVIIADTATEEQIEEIGKQILEIDGVRNAEFISKEKAYEYTINNVCKNCNDCQSKGYIGCNTFRFAKKAYMDCAKELKCCGNCKHFKFLDELHYRSCIKDGEKVNGNWIGINYRSCCFDLEKWESK